MAGGSTQGLFFHLMHKPTRQVPNVARACGLVLNTYTVQTTVSQPWELLCLGSVISCQLFPVLYTRFGGVCRRSGGAHVNL